nr:hypothetical protein [Tanacetum cinerariifolium]
MPGSVGFFPFLYKDILGSFYPRCDWVTASSPKSNAAPDLSSADPPDDGNSKMDLYDGFWMTINDSWISQIQVWVLLKCVKPMSYKCLVFCSAEDHKIITIMEDEEDI